MVYIAYIYVPDSDAAIHAPRQPKLIYQHFVLHFLQCRMRFDENQCESYVFIQSEKDHQLKYCSTD